MDNKLVENPPLFLKSAKNMLCVFLIQNPTLTAHLLINIMHTLNNTVSLTCFITRSMTPEVPTTV